MKTNKSGLRHRERDGAFIPARNWPDMLIELALERGQSEHKLLRNTGTFREDIGCQKYLTPQQVFRLMENAISPRSKSPVTCIFTTQPTCAALSSDGPANYLASFDDKPFARLFNTQAWLYSPAL